MKNLIFVTVILSFLSSPSFGEWKEVGQNIDGVYLIEIDTVRKNGNLSYYNDIGDFFESKGYGLSSKGRSVINCKTKEYKRLSQKWYEESMGRGEVTHTSFVTDRWYEFDSDSIIGKIFKLVC